MVLQATGIVFFPDDGAQAQKHVGVTQQMYVYNRYCALSR